MKQLLFILLFTGFLSSGLNAQSKIAHANYQAMLDTLPSHKKAVQDITRIQLDGQKELLQMKSEFDKQVADFELKVQKKEFSPAIQEYEASRLRKMEENLFNREKELTDLIQRLAAESDDKSLELIKKAVDTVAKRKGLNYVLELSSLLYSNGTDITNEIITELLLLDKQ